MQPNDFQEPILKVNDLFCGAGGMGLGFKYAGFRLAGAWDFDKYAVESYGNNVSPKVKQADITQMKWDELPAADVWTFGFPCQDLSVAGKQAGLFEGKRSGLFFEVMRLLDETKEHAPERLPSVILAENVKGLKPYLDVLRTEYRKRGYKMVHTLYNSKYWGVPQNRERYFVAGIHESIKQEFIFPTQQTDFVPKLSTILETEVDEKFYISDEKAAKIIEQAREGLKVKQATKKGFDIAVEGDSINLSHPNSQTRRGRVGKQVAQTLLTGQEQVVVEPSGIYTQVSERFQRGPLPGLSRTLKANVHDAGVIYEDEQPLKSVHPCITPDRLDKRQNGRRAKEEEAEMFTLTAQDLHGIIIDDRGFKEKEIQPKEISPTLRAEEHGNAKKVIEKVDEEKDLHGIIYDDTQEGFNGIRIYQDYAPTLRAGRQGQKVIETLGTDEPHLKFVGGLGEPKRFEDGKELSRNFNDQNRVYDEEGIAPCIPATTAVIPKVLTKEPQPDIQVIGRAEGINGHDLLKRVYDTDGISPTLNTCGGGNTQPKILVDEQPKINQIAHKGSGGQKGWIHDPNGIVGAVTATDYKDPKHIISGEPEQEGILFSNNRAQFTDVSNTLLSRQPSTALGNDTPITGVVTTYRVRKLTPREYARLQGFPETYKQVVSNSQFYKQMGNAVTVNVAAAIADQIKKFLIQVIDEAERSDFNPGWF